MKRAEKIKDIYLTGKELEEIKTCTLEKLQLILKSYIT